MKELEAHYFITISVVSNLDKDESMGEKLKERIFE